MDSTMTLLQCVATALSSLGRIFEIVAGVYIALALFSSANDIKKDKDK